MIKVSENQNKMKMDTMTKAITSKDLKFGDTMPMWKATSVHKGVVEYSGHKPGCELGVSGLEVNRKWIQ